jgi:predicted nucleic acid-binding protein
VVKYIPKFSEHYPIPVEIMHKTLELLPLLVKPRSFYKAKLAEAKVIMDAKDPDDVDVAALALELDAPVWSNDNDFLGFPLGRYTTAELLKTLGM